MTTLLVALALISAEPATADHVVTVHAEVSFTVAAPYDRPVYLCGPVTPVCWGIARVVFLRTPQGGWLRVVGRQLINGRVLVHGTEIEVDARGFQVLSPEPEPPTFTWLWGVD